MTIVPLTGRTLCQIEDTSILWQRYAAAMRRRRPQSVLGHNRFGRYVRRSSALWAKDCVLIGQEAEGTFYVSHICPRSIRAACETLKALIRAKTTVVIAVTTDLSDMLRRLGYFYHGTAIVPFRGEDHEKMVFSNKEVL